MEKREIAKRLIEAALELKNESDSINSIGVSLRNGKEIDLNVYMNDWYRSNMPEDLGKVNLHVDDDADESDVNSCINEARTFIDTYAARLDEWRASQRSEQEIKEENAALKAEVELLRRQLGAAVKKGGEA